MLRNINILRLIFGSVFGGNFGLTLVLPSSMRALTLLQEELIAEMLAYADQMTNEEKMEQE